MKALAGTVCALFAAGCMAPGPLVPQSPTALHQPFASTPSFAWAPPPGGPESIPVVALPAELFAPEQGNAVRVSGAPTAPVRLASLRPGVVETALIVPGSSAPAEQGPMLIAAAADPPTESPAASTTPSVMTASAEATTIVENPASADHLAAPPPAIAFQQPGASAAQPNPTFVQPGPTFAPGQPGFVSPGQPGFVSPGGPAMISPGAPIIVDDMPIGGIPGPGGAGGPCGPCNTCSPWIGTGGAAPHGGCCLLDGLFSVCGLLRNCCLFGGGGHGGGFGNVGGPCGGCSPCGGAPLLGPAPGPVFGGFGPGPVYGGFGTAGPCDPCGAACDPCGVPCGGVAPRTCFTVFGEFLFLTARGADVAFATPTDGLGLNGVPIGNTLVADPTYDSGYRVGGSYAFNPRTSLLLMYTDYESSVDDGESLPGGTGFLRATLVHPNTIAVAGDVDFLSAQADYEIDFLFADIGLTHDLWRDCESRLTSHAGLRYASLDQRLLATYSVLGVTQVSTDLEFEGIGPRLGIDAERFLNPRFSVYGNGFANFLPGSFDGSYDQRNLVGVQASAGIEDDRIVTVLEAEIGIAYRPPCGWWRANVGYYVAGWYNVITTSEFVQAVQADDFSDVDDTLTFDGLTARLQFEF